MVKHGVKDQPTRTSAEDNTRVIAITSGKGGVGKTNIVANLGFSLSQLGKKVLILDADVGLGNLDILLGLTPRYNLSHVIAGIKTIGQITMDGPGNMTILPASSGIQELSELTKEQKIQILSQLDSLLDPIDVLLIDTAAGISSNVMSFSCTAQEIIVVVSPEPTSITDAYALMKVLFLKHSESHFKLLVNLAHDSEEADEVFRQLNLVAQRFLDISIEYIGHVLLDSNLTKSVKRQKLVCETYPNSVGSGCFTSLAHKISESRPKAFPEGHSHFFWDQIL
ncbi:MAG: MinD/ParA family protein [Thermodesulfobacteriota bacterium]|nr:MinD/ParA family protein [Thermodesulfobacteriota bacterium]